MGIYDEILAYYESKIINNKYLFIYTWRTINILVGFHFIESEFTLKLKLKVKDFTKQTLNVLMLIILMF